MPARLRIGIIGCGLIAQVMHLPYLRELEDQFELAAICDLSEPLVQRIGDRFGIDRRFQRWQDLLDEPLDAVMVLTSGSHAPVAIAAMDAGRHVFVEKPMCFSVDEGQDMIRSAEKAGVHLMVGYMKRYEPAYERLQHELEAFQDLRLVQVTTLESPLEPYVRHYQLEPAPQRDPEVLEQLKIDDERRVEQAIGSVPETVRQMYRWTLLDSVVHELNALRGAVGEPDTLSYADIRQQGVTAVMSFGGAQCLLTWVDLPGIARYQQDYSFVGPDRRATLSFPSPFLRSMPAQLIIEGGTVGSSRSWRSVETTSYEEAFKRELMEFYASIDTDREPRTSGRDGVRDIALCQAIVSAHVSRKPVQFPTAIVD
jgi:predicted dehydrogenase